MTIRPDDETDMHAAPHTTGDRPLVLSLEDLADVEAVPLDQRDLPASTYELLARAAARHAGTPALHLLGEDPDGDANWRRATCWSYGELFAQVTRAANLFHSLGLTPGAAVALMAPNSGATHAALFGAQAAGIANPVNPMLAPEHIAAILALTKAQILVAAGPSLNPEIWDRAVRIAQASPGLRAVLSLGGAPADRPAGYAGDFAELALLQPGDRLIGPYRPGPQDLAAYFHTGGTTGAPKVAPHTHRNEVYMAWVLGCSGAFVGDAVSLAGLPLFHVNAVHVTGLAPFLHGRPVVNLGPRGYRDRTLMADFWRIIEHYRVTGFSGVPTVYAALPPVPAGVDISSLRAAGVGAAPLPKTVRNHFESATKVPLMEGYGLTEATCATAATPAFGPRAGSVGLRLPYQRVKAVLLDGAERPLADCAAGQIGVLAIAGPSVFPGYLTSGPNGPFPDPSGKIFDGWLLTGDLGRVDEDGYVYLTGRAKDLIIRGGHNIDPGPIEESLLGHPDITSAAVIGAPDPHAGEIPVAYVTLGAGARVTEAELCSWAAVHAPEPAAAPKAVHVIEALPLTAIGKVFKPALLQDAIRRAISAELCRAGLTAQIAMSVQDGRPHALIDVDLDGDALLLTTRLERYSFPFTIRGTG
jgi:fatty-acyl-CoA synthase